MSNHITCNRGHFYPATLNKCPFCEREKVGGSATGTEVIEPIVDQDDDRTRPVNVPPQPTSNPSPSPHSTGESTRRVTPSNPGGSSDEDRTQIHRPAGSPGGNDQPVASRRRLEGWLVSFTMDPAGVDFRLYEGKNLVGRDSACDIKLINDPKISSKHALIFFRGIESVFTDEFSSNASYINDQIVGLGDRIPLQDGARIKMGDHEFIFRKVNP